MTIQLYPELLTKESFAPFGELINAEGNAFDANYGFAQRFNDISNMVFDAQGGKPNISIFRSKPIAMPMKVTVMEKHELGSQAFIGIQNQSFLTLVAPAGPTIAAEDLKLFMVAAGQGVNYYPGTWHHYLICLGNESDFLCLDRLGTEPDCKEHHFDESVIISI